jgi:hypothetical protein
LGCLDTDGQVFNQETWRREENVCVETSADRQDFGDRRSLDASDADPLFSHRH